MKYIQNVHNWPITAHARNEKGEVVLNKTFLPARADKYTGRVEATGFTQLTDEEYKLLNESSRTLKVYRDKHKLLIEHDELPPEAKTPHEALVDARKEVRKSAEEIASLNEEVLKLKAAVLDAETKYRQLESASTDDEKLRAATKELHDTVAHLDADKKALQGTIEELLKEKEALQGTIEELFKEKEALKDALEKTAKTGGKKGKEFD